MNPYLKNLEKIEFVVTNACSGRCKHCSEGEHTEKGVFIDPKVASDVVRKIASAYEIKTVMTFGGEPLLYPKTVKAVMTVAKEMNIPKRQVITNGYFSKNPSQIKAVAEMLKDSGANDILLSVDAFHQETIPLDIVKLFAEEIKKTGIFIQLQPAWLVSENSDNAYNRKTREIIASFTDLSIYSNQGNIIFPEGNALKYLAEYFVENKPANPYIEDNFDVRCVSFSSNGDVLHSNVYERDIMEIIKDYTPQTKE